MLIHWLTSCRNFVFDTTIPRTCCSMSSISTVVSWSTGSFLTLSCNSSNIFPSRDRRCWLLFICQSSDPCAPFQWHGVGVGLNSVPFLIDEDTIDRVDARELTVPVISNSAWREMKSFWTHRLYAIEVGGPLWSRRTRKKNAEKRIRQVLFLSRHQLNVMCSIYSTQICRLVWRLKCLKCFYDIGITDEGSRVRCSCFWWIEMQ